MLLAGLWGWRDIAEGMRCVTFGAVGREMCYFWGGGGEGHFWGDGAVRCVTFGAVGGKMNYS